MSCICESRALSTKAVHMERLLGLWDPAAVAARRLGGALLRGKEGISGHVQSAQWRPMLAGPLAVPTGGASGSFGLLCRGSRRQAAPSLPALPLCMHAWRTRGPVGGRAGRSSCVTVCPADARPCLPSAQPAAFGVSCNRRTRTAAPCGCRGGGVIVEGQLLDVSRHLILDDADRKERYFVLYVKPRFIHRRRFDPKGNEVDPNFSGTQKVNTGFLMASYISLAKLDAGTVAKCNFAGDGQAGASWTDSILAFKDCGQPSNEPRGAGAEDAEWPGGARIQYRSGCTYLSKHLVHVLELNQLKLIQQNRTRLCSGHLTRIYCYNLRV
ncbi:arpin isoform X2 [Rhineura floridana]|uniref:arpin isoform X2 n=1 Tax=Rhineura floridana TaxID=261503 RepID=UPI002AC7ED88|nr:arpin isoform X2 [Rhineura floridana]